MSVHYILTHPGSAHKDDFLACCLLVARHQVEVVRREPTEEDLQSDRVCVVDVGGEHDPAKHNYDHHQFPKDHDPICALSLVLQSEGLYEDALLFCDWLETAEWFDARGPVATARKLGVEREVLTRLNSPMDVTLLRRFAHSEKLFPGDPLWMIMSYIGEDLIAYLRSMRDRLQFLKNHTEFWTVKTADGGAFETLFLPRTDPLPSEPSMGLDRFLVQEGAEERVIALVYPDRRGSGFGLSRHRDCPLLDFYPLKAEPDVHFAHKQGFVAKTSATDPERLRELLAMAYRG